MAAFQQRGRPYVRERRLLGLFAHPDDESRITGGALAKYASEGVVVALVVATRGEAGSCGEPPLCSPDELPQVREAELCQACDILGVADLTILDYRDGTLPTIDRHALAGHFVAAIRRVRPDVIVTFGPEGRTLHPDHIAVHNAATAAYDLASDQAAYPGQGLRAFATPKLYYTTLPNSLVRAIDWGFPGIPDEEVTCALDISPWLDQKKRATNEAHRTQAHDQPFENLPEAERWQALSVEYFRLAASRIPHSPSHELDLFSGIA